MSDYAYKGGKEPGKASEDPHIKEEQMSEDEFDRMMAERYRNGSGLVTYAEDSHDHKSSVDRDIYVPSANDATLWKVKCMVDVFIFGVALYLYDLIMLAMLFWIYCFFFLLPFLSRLDERDTRPFVSCKNMQTWYI